MIGQNELLERIQRLIKEDNYPRFSIFVGERGSGRKYLASFVSELLHASFIFTEDNSIASIRNIIEQSYKLKSRTVYRIADADTMSPEAKNALLKVTEESPNNAYFIMTLQDENNTLHTIRSRAQIFHMQLYTQDELEAYIRYIYEDTLENKDIELCKTLCDTPGEAEMLLRYNPSEFYAYVEKVVDNINKVNLANTFKIAEKVALKDEEDKYDLKLFCKAFQNVAWDKQIEGYVRMIRITSEYLQLLKIRGINKTMLFDNWILEIRGEGNV